MSLEYDVVVSVSDNGDNAEKQRFLEKLSVGNSRFRVQIQRPPIGMYQNFAALFAACTQPYGMLVCDDDWVAPGYLVGADAILDARPDVAGVMGVFLHLAPEFGAKLHSAVNIVGEEPESRIRQYLEENDGFNHPVYSVVRTSTLRPFSLYVKNHPFATSFFDYLIAFSLLARGGFITRNCGPYVYVNTNWTTPESVRRSNARSYSAYGLPDWFTDFHTLYRAVEGFRFLAGRSSPVNDPALRDAAGVSVLTHYLRMLKFELSRAPQSWWEHMGALNIRQCIEPFAKSDELKISDVLTWFSHILRVASPEIHERYTAFHKSTD
jgi:hypothetical protein